MLKKIILGGLLLALVGVLVVGGINRTAARGDETSSNQHGQTTQSVAQRGGRNGSGGNQGSVAAAGEANATEWQTVIGTVFSVDASHLEVTLNDGSSVEVGGRAWQLAAAQNFTAQAGDKGYLARLRRKRCLSDRPDRQSEQRANLEFARYHRAAPVGRTRPQLKSDNIYWCAPAVNGLGALLMSKSISKSVCSERSRRSTAAT